MLSIRPTSRTHLMGVALSAALVASTVACDSTSSPVTPPSAGSQFAATISGTVTAQLNGQAESIGATSGTPAWAIQMTTGNSTEGIVFNVEGMGRPAPGTYVIASALDHGGNAPNQEFTAVVGLANPFDSFGSLSGTLRITDSSASAVSGTFTFTAQDATNPGRTVTVDGTFTANNRDL